MAKRPERHRVERIVSGGQSGADRGALDAAIRLGIEHGGWCPRGRRAEDGRIPDHYQLRETDESDYAARTGRNVVDSDATLIFSRGKLKGGSQLTRELAQQHGKPCQVVRLDDGPSLHEIRRWLAEHRVRVLNVAGPRESQEPGIAADVEQSVVQLLGNQ